jgi:hypothetical protein
MTTRVRITAGRMSLTGIACPMPAASTATASCNDR